jgi:hypothetical protein
MNTRQHIQKKHPSQSTYTPIQNLYQTRAFDIQQQPSHSSSGQENVDLDADHEQSQYKLYNLPYIPVNAPGTEPPPPIQTQLNSGEPTNYYQQGSADVPWYNRPTYPNIPVNAPGTEPPPPIQTKLTIGQPGDKYEQEADQVASQVVQQINSPVSEQSAQGQTVQREDAPPEEEEQVQAKSISNTIQREEVPEEEEQVQAKSISNTIQREELPEEEQLQGKSLKGEMAATPNLETSIQGAKGSGQPLDENIRQPMEKAFGGVDFSQVKVHTDGQSDQLNRSIQARAFTTGEDVFFRQGEYNPGSRGGQELLAHELTHVVQQSGGALHGGNKTVSFQKIQSSQIVQCDRTEKQKNYSAYHPNIRHDHGHLDDGNGNIDNSKRRSATVGDYTALAYWTAKLNVAEKLRPDLIDATDAYRHFLFGRGTTRTINYDRFIESDKSGQTIIQSAAKNILDKARKRHNEFLIDNPGGDNVNNPR